MLLTAHAIVGAASGRLTSNLSLAFVFGFVSHFLLDLIPHWGYSLKSLQRDTKNPLNKDMILGKQFLRDLIYITFDFLTGIIIAVFIFGNSLSVWFGIIGGLLPDALQFVYIKFRHQPFLALQKLHIWSHLKRTEDIPAYPFGILFQAIAVGAAIGLSLLVR